MFEKFQQLVKLYFNWNRWRSHSWLPMLGLFLFALMMELPGSWKFPFVDRDEAYYAEVSREMNERADYVVPHFNGKPWLEKPPLLYWCQSISFRLFGENEFAARLPAIIATGLTTLAVWSLAATIYSTPIAWRAALIFLLSIEVSMAGRAGIIDMLLTLFTTLALRAGWEIYRCNLRPIWWWTFYLALAGAALAKGPVAVLPVGTLLLFARLSPPNSLHRSMKWIRGLSLTLLLVAFWLVPVVILTKGEFLNKFFGDQVLFKLFHVQQGHGASHWLTYLATLPFYFILLIPTFLPWSFYIPAAYRRLKTEMSPGDKYLLSGILLTFVLFSLLRTKLPHYTLPAFPLIACAIAPSVPDKPFRWLCAGMIVLSLSSALILPSLFRPYSVPLQLASSPLLQPEMNVITVDYSEPAFVWYMRKHVKSWIQNMDQKEGIAFMKKPGSRLCVFSSKARVEAPDPSMESTTVRGFDAVHGRWVELTMWIKSN